MTTVETLPAATCKRHFNGVLPYSGRDLQLTPTLRRVLYMALSAFLSLRIVAMFYLPLTDTTEARYSEIARKMVETANWITLQFDYGVPFWGKPPLHTWLSALGMQLFGTHEAAARLPILLVSLLLLAVLWVWLRGIIGRNIALVSVTVLMSPVLFFGASAFVMTDMPMTLGTVLVMAGFWSGACRETPSRAWGMLVFVGLAVGRLAKGPVTVVLCTIPLFLWLALGGNWGALKHLPWGPGLALATLMAAPWYIAAEIATPGFLHYFIIGEHCNRFVVSGWSGIFMARPMCSPRG
ncbi:ArnT family glycosyltransferase [Pseudophaeobacter leonis]|uniref:ArnT family glycosyltransferase n=1 Tax=Pseudophaeobacter leonis TaxID=1144477 RepID=UPI0009F66DA6|nr:phospholipid carrier-dependent glycosyltransferase [Pseudophaeobacter leonis]